MPAHGAVCMARRGAPAARGPAATSGCGAAAIALAKRGTRRRRATTAHADASMRRQIGGDDTGTAAARWRSCSVASPIGAARARARAARAGAPRGVARSRARPRALSARDRLGVARAVAARRSHDGR
ncbi:MAG: hypothetical protein WDW36_008299 [Sanguina aurantia]